MMGRMSRICVPYNDASLRIWIMCREIELCESVEMQKLAECNE
jgi:hypothetical protein